MYPFLVLDLDFIQVKVGVKGSIYSGLEKKRIDEWVDKQLRDNADESEDDRDGNRRHDVLSFKSKKSRDELQDVAPVEITRNYVTSQLERCGVPKMDKSRFDFLIQTICNVFPRWQCLTSDVFDVKHCEIFESNRRREKPIRASTMRFLQLAVDEDDENWTPYNVKRSFHMHRRWYVPNSIT